jgi:CRP-like cAMP-binding protein
MPEVQDGAQPRLGTAAIVDYLSGHRVFGIVPKTALHEIAAEVLERRYEKGHYFFHTGDAAGHVFAIVSGLATLAEDDCRGRDHTLYTLSSGDIFGIAATILGIPRTRSAKALTGTHVLLVKRETFEDLQRRFPAFARNVTFEVCRLLCHSEKTAGQFAFSTVTSRVTKLFLDGDSQVTQEYLSSHRELAVRVGCSRETITRVLSRLERAGIVCTGRGRVRILDRGKLKSLAESGG